MELKKVVCDHPVNIRRRVAGERGKVTTKHQSKRDEARAEWDR